MNKLISFCLIIVLLFSLSACSNSNPTSSEISENFPQETSSGASDISENSPQETSSEASDISNSWKLEYYVDEFKQPTERWYIRSSKPFWGTFSNSATENSELAVDILVDEEAISIVLYEYGNYWVKNQWYDYQIEYKVKMRIPGMDDLETTGFMYSRSDGGDRIFIVSPAKDFIIDTLLSGDEISFSVRSESNSFTKYLFTIQADNFLEIYESATA